jgi:hypothetical protein
MSSCNINEIVVYYGGTNKAQGDDNTLVCFNDMYIFNPEPNFKALKEFEFQHYFPYKKDKIYIFVREHEK